MSCKIIVYLGKSVHCVHYRSDYVLLCYRVFYAQSMFLSRYGHGYELYAVAASPQGNLIASTCKVDIHQSLH